MGLVDLNHRTFDLSVSCSTQRALGIGFEVEGGIRLYGDRCGLRLKTYRFGLDGRVGLERNARRSDFDGRWRHGYLGASTLEHDRGGRLEKE